MTNRLLSLIAAAALMTFALALRTQRKPPTALTPVTPQERVRMETNVPGYIFSRN